MRKWQKTRFPGVRYREGEKRSKGKLDRYFVIRYKRAGTAMEEPVGWTSEGMSAQLAANERTEIRKNVRLGEGPQSLKEKREIKAAEKKAEIELREEEKRDQTPFSVLAEKYLEWSDTLYDHGNTRVETDKLFLSSP